MTTVLIVDDHPSFRATARALLESEGFEVVGEAEDGGSALQRAEELHPEIVLLDVQLPDIDGFEVASLVDDRRRRAPRRPRLEPRPRRLRLENRGIGRAGFIAKAELCGPHSQTCSGSSTREAAWLLSVA